MSYATFVRKTPVVSASAAQSATSASFGALRSGIHREDGALERAAETMAEQVTRTSDPVSVAQPGHKPFASPRPSQDTYISLGQPLDSETRRFFEPKFGWDFSRVRVHTDSQAAQSASSLRANAFTAGTSIVFAEGRYAPSKADGRRLIAHELAHVIQQSHAESLMIQRDPEDPTPATPELVKSRQAQTGWIKDPAPSGTLDEKSWTGEKPEKQIADLAKVAQTKKVFIGPAALKDPDAVNIVGDKSGATYMPGLNFSDKILARGETFYVDPAGGPPIKTLNPSRTGTLPKIAIVLGKDALANKQLALTALRHEMMHAEHLNMTLSMAEKWRKDKRSTVAFEDWVDERQKATKTKIPDVDRELIRDSDLAKSAANTELLAYTEGFMTAFLLRSPPPTDNGDAVFVELFGMISSGWEPWAYAKDATRAQALGRLQQYYCQVLDPPHQKAFKDFVDKPPSSKPTVTGDWTWAPKRQLHEHFFAGLKTITDANCKGLGGIKKPASSGSSTPKKRGS